MTRRRAISVLVGFGALSSSRTAHAPAQEISRAQAAVASPWLTLPPAPRLPEPTRIGLIEVNQTRIYFAQFGKGPPVLLLHGGMGNSDFWGHQIVELAQNYLVTVMDTRGHGRSPVTSNAFGFAIFAKDVSALLDFLELSSVAVIGWSDGAITGLQFALSHDKRVSKLFTFGANVSPDGVIPGGSRSKVFSDYVKRCKDEYAKLSSKPDRWGQLVAGLGRMWRREPNFTKAQLGGIKIPVTIADAEHDEIIRRGHANFLAAAIPAAKLVMMPGVSHFAMLQSPKMFNEALLRFLNANS